MLKRLGKILAFVVGAVLIGAVGIGINFWVRSRDLPSAGDEDMRLPRSEIPATENAFAALQEAAERLQWPEGQDEQVAHLLQGKEADPVALASLLAAKRDALASLDEALRIGRLQVPREEPGDKTPYSILAWRRLGQLLCLRVLADVERGELRRALDDSLQLLRFGHMVEGAQGHLLGYLMGNALKSNGLSQLRRVLAEKRVASGDLRGLVGRLESFRPEARSFREALQGEYSYMAALIDDPKRLSSGGDFQADRKKWEDIERAPSLLQSYIYQKNATKKLYADEYREIAQSCERHCSQIELHDSPIKKPALLDMVYEPNIVGRVMAAIGLPSLQKLVLGKCRLQTEISATELLVALRAYQAERHESAPSLDELIPDYLPSHPVDDFDGRPIRYLQGMRAVYSVGENLVDDGGNPQKDIVFSVEF